MDHITSLALHCLRGLMLVCFCVCSFYLLFIPFYLFIYLLKNFQPQIVLILFLFFEQFRLNVLIKFVLNKKKKSVTPKNELCFP